MLTTTGRCRPRRLTFSPGRLALLSLAALASTSPIASGITIYRNTAYAANQSPAQAIDRMGTKYLNKGGARTGILVTPAKGATVANSITFYPASDNSQRDPVFYQLLGTNQPLDGSETEFDSYDFTLISQGVIDMPTARNPQSTNYETNSSAPSWTGTFENTEAYTSYIVVTPALRGNTATWTQVSDIQLSGDEGNIFTPGDPVIGVKTARPIVEFSRPAPAADTSEETCSFGVIFIPDTQFYSRYAIASSGKQFLKRFGSDPFVVQTEWIAEFANTLGCPMTIHVGDVVDRASNTDEWAHANSAMKVLDDANVPYSVLAGNHDVRNSGQWSGDRTLSNELYLDYFDTARAQLQSTYQGMSPDGFNQYHIFEFQGQQFLNIALSWRADSDSLAWAQQVIDNNPTLPVILSTHNYLAVESDGKTAASTDYGDFLWENLIRGNDQIFMGIGGHNHGSAHRVRTNDFGNEVLEVVVDYQMAYQGGNGYLRLCEFDLHENVIRSLTFSPWVPEKPEESLNEYDLAVLADASNEYVTPMNFAQRFAGFTNTFPNGTVNRDEPLIETVRKMILDGYEEPEAVTPEEPFDIADYPRNPGQTVAHWRFDNGSEGQAVAVGETISDLGTGQNPLTHSATQVGDTRWSRESHSLTPATGSVHFSNAFSDGNNFFSTLTEAPLNDMFFRDGYTVEAVVKIDENWSASENAWMKILTRDGQRGSLNGWSGSYGTSSPLAFGVSNLREIQWEPVMYRANGNTYASAAWSGEILSGTWMHIAIVNDPDTHDTTMYVAGAPVLRNVNSADGMAGFEDLPWTVGARSSGGSGGSGFFGYISEIRISEGALSSDQWLTARKTRVRGTGGRQLINGTSGDDQIFGNMAADVLNGGEGSDTFVFQSTRDGMDTISDFNPAEDLLNLSGLLDEMRYSGTDPFGDGKLRLLDSSRGAVLQYENPRRAGSYRNLIIFSGLEASDLQGQSILIF
ncbi:MAG: LamG-like jellyroll fold domain-containing protein [Verrucomicrobiota bacterium JB023]|nr:LamG-like jellyroll fold domain-containing protein [Verrucomicrobiota bacterium JB023]